MSGRPEWHTPPSGAVPMVDVRLLGGEVLSDHIYVIGGDRDEPGRVCRTHAAQRKLDPPCAPVPVQNLDRADSVRPGGRQVATRDCPHVVGSDRNHHGERLFPRGAPIYLPSAAVPPLDNASARRAGLTNPHPSPDRPQTSGVI